MKTFKVTFFMTDKSTETATAEIKGFNTKAEAIAFVETFGGGNGIDTNIVLAAEEI